MKNTCCVPNCGSKRSGVKLHKFPKTDSRRKWVQCINSEKLKKLNIKELLSMFVCHKHFERRFVTASSRLKSFAYPTLFTQEEMDTGIPSTAYENNENILLCDHDYAQKLRKPHIDHSYSRGRPLLEIQQFQFMRNTDCDTAPTASISNIEEEVLLPHLIECNKPSTSTQCAVETITKSGSNVLMTPMKRQKFKRSYSTKNFVTPRCHQILMEYKKAKKQLNFAKRAKKAIKFSKKENFEKLTSKLNPVAKKILWMQINQSTKKTKGRRFTDEEKMIALAIMKQSPKSYRFLRRIFILPSVRIINKMITTLKMDSGINPRIFQTIKSEIAKWPETKKYCSVLFDEVALEPGLAYDKHSDSICGFVELNEKANNYADHALVFMVRGALHKWQQPVCFYFCEGATSGTVLKNIIKTVVTEVTKTGLLPVALICDQGTSFQSAIKKLKEETKRHQIQMDETYDDTIIIENQKISILYDPPHLIKGIRNNFLNKNIKYNGKISKWDDIVDVYNTDCKHAEMRMLHKLNDEHVIPQKIKKMKVKNCTRVLSKTVASALRYTANFSHYVDGKLVSETLLNTAKMVSFFDDLFDSCNGSSITIKNKGKPLRQAASKNSKHISFWKDAIKKLEDLKFIDNNARECVVPSQKNFITTLKSLIRLWHFFQSRGCKLMRPRYFNTDPLENFFGQVRAYSFRNNDPNCKLFKNIFRSLLITRFIHFHSDTYNCEDSSGDQIIKLKNLFHHNQEDNLEMITSSCQTATIMSPGEKENLITEARRERLNVHSRAYTAGWVVRKCLNKFNCSECKNNLTQNNESSVHTWISHREFKDFKKKMKLTYPSEQAVNLFSVIVNQANEYLELQPNVNFISREIEKRIGRHNFNFLTCEKHYGAICDYFLDVTIKLCLFNWCSVINKILRGVDLLRLNEKQLPDMQRKALEKYTKKLKNKMLHK
ncbi:unnamed protein product [Diatraea saccharalis]|uniref:THAP-type domain-containing protein n=1 Tax=Diatraea saccharalis TaxID=40085 RepID=A0A9N9N4U3_9NEOP|nr:unnamed protein product [Diatraea saccharalis]